MPAITAESSALSASRWTLNGLGVAQHLDFFNFVIVFWISHRVRVIIFAILPVFSLLSGMVTQLSFVSEIARVRRLLLLLGLHGRCFDVVSEHADALTVRLTSMRALTHHIHSSVYKVG